MNGINEFITQFKPKLMPTGVLTPGQFLRWPAFEFIAKDLFSRKKPIYIVETGSAKTLNDWMGYGQASFLWDWILTATNGLGYSVDIDPNVSFFGRKHLSRIRFINADSIAFLRGFSTAQNLDLLYLDSYDWSPEKQALSSLHHIGELAAIYERLPSGCLIAVDDCHNEKQGKHIMVRDFFTNLLQQAPVFKSFIHVWKKK